ncbi:hypothetical protein [Parasitella parasitica]|uniref:Uncharacterized protein n=1 Tax=Parasitella parasitica TaxID=35722 RepID=A0A0B7NUR1_9FUNG|nr:hypothetical protein [Parasitella parasitica]
MNKHQHNAIAKKVFSGDLVDDLAESMASETMNYTLRMSKQNYMTMPVLALVARGRISGTYVKTKRVPVAKQWRQMEAARSISADDRVLSK